MKKKEIKEKFEKVGEKIKSLEEGQEDLYEITQFVLETIRKYSDEPIYRIRTGIDPYRHLFLKDFILQYIYKNKVKKIETYEDIQSAELFAYCDTHFILKNNDNEYFLVDMAKGIITKIPTQFLFSKEMNLIIDGKVLKVCHASSGVLEAKHD